MNRQNHDILDGLPGAERILQGLLDFHDNRHTIAACLVRIARPRLVKAGLMTPSTIPDVDAELDLYHLLANEGNQAHSRYNALLREAVSFERALDQRMKESRADSQF